MKQHYGHFGLVMILILVVCVSCTSRVTETTNPTDTIVVPQNTDDDPGDSIATTDDPEGSATDGWVLTGVEDGDDVLADAAGFADCGTAGTQAFCLAAGGTWTIFQDGCRDSCYAQTHAEILMCIQSAAWGCDCGENRCWNECTQMCTDL